MPDFKRFCGILARHVRFAFTITCAEPVRMDEDEMKAWIFDVDGTLANTDHRKHFLECKPKNWDGWHSRAYLDTPHLDICELVQLGQEAGYAAVLCSGRGEEQRAVTENWLAINAVDYSRLYMRRAGDRRDDSIIKLELLELMRADGFDPVLAFDDRDRVVAAWRGAGIRCLQVAPGSF